MSNKANEPAQPRDAMETVAGGGPLKGPASSAAEGARVEGERSYELIRLLGEGGMGRVFLAERADGEFHQQVAIKLLAWFLGDDEAAARRFRVERQILAQLNHPNIARLLDGGSTAEGQSYLVMEFVEGEPIDRFADERALSVEERVRLFLKVCDAVRVAHQRLVVHRDLKPGNILVTADGEPKLLDFGIAKLLTPEPGIDSVQTQHGEILLTPRYASPEQMRGESITTASDVYALGVVLYELLAGRSPYRDESLALLRLPQAVCHEMPPPPSQARGDTTWRRHVSADLDAIVLKALRKEASGRYASVEALADDLRRWLEGLPVAARDGNTAYQVRKFLERHRWAVAVSALVVSLLMGWAVSLRYQLAETEKERHLAESARELLVEVVGGRDPSTVRNRELTAAEVLDRAAARVRARSQDPAELRASLLASLGRVYLSLGLLQQAEPLLEDALAGGLASGPAHAAERARAVTALAQLRYQQGRAEESVSLLRDVLEREGQQLDAGLRAAMKSLLGRSLVERGDFGGGETALREALAIGRQSPDTSRAELVECLVNLGLVIACRQPVNRRDEAEAFLEEAIALSRKAAGNPTTSEAVPVDPMLRVGALENLAWIRLDAGDWQAAEPLLEEAETIAREQLGNDHPSLLDLRNYRAIVDWRRGDFAAAEATLRQALGRHPEWVGYPTYERLRGNLGAMEILQGRFADGEAKVLDALAAHRDSGTVGWADLFYDLWILSFSAYDRGDLEAARDYAAEATAEARRLPAGLPYVPLGELYRGAAESWLVGPEAGEPILRRAVDAQRSDLPEDHPDRTTGLAELAAALLRLGRVDEAAKLAREAAEVASNLPQDHWERSWALAVSAAVDVELGVEGDIESSNAVIERHLPRLVARHGATHPRVVWLRQEHRVPADA